MCMEDTKLNSHSGSELQKFKISSFSLCYTSNMSLDKIRKNTQFKIDYFTWFTSNWFVL